MNYDVNYFISKFEKIPAHKWCTGVWQRVESGQGCAFGNCGVTSSNDIAYIQEAESLSVLMGGVTSVLKINDGEDPKYKQLLPKQRILAALYDIKKMQEPVRKDITKSLAVLPVDETRDVKMEIQIDN